MSSYLHLIGGSGGETCEGGGRAGVYQCAVGVSVLLPVSDLEVVDICTVAVGSGVGHSEAGAADGGDRGDHGVGNVNP